MTDKPWIYKVVEYRSGPDTDDPLPDFVERAYAILSRIKTEGPDK